MNIEEFRESYINEINAEALNTQRYPVEVFIDSATDILKNDYSLITDISQCFYEFKGNRAYKNMHIDAAYLDLPAITLNLLIADFNDGEVKNITSEFLNLKTKTLFNYFENCLKGFFVNAEQANPAVQLARDIKANIGFIHKIHLFVVSTDKLSKAVKTLDLPDYTYGAQTFKVSLNVLDIEGVYRSKLVCFTKNDILIKCSDFGIDGVPCIKAEIETDQYESYLAIIPGQFLADIYKKYNASLLEANVRSFLKFNGGVNKGIRKTILNEKSRFFTYNNGISTTAKSIELKNNPVIGLMITSFTNLQIINGGQTTATLAATSIKNEADLSGIFVQMKLTILKNDDPEMIRNIATYANSQNKIKSADLNSSHPFYVRMENFSRKLYAPLESGQFVQKLWFFERTRGQYEQPMMQMTKKQRDDYKLVRPKEKKFTLTDLSKYMNAAAMLPYYVSWGSEINASHFHNRMLKQWDNDNTMFGELFYKELIGKKIMFAYIEHVISDQEWYQERRAYRPQIVAYTFAKLVYETQRAEKRINYRQIWDNQKISDIFEIDIARIGKLVFDSIYDENRSSANIETYCKKEECWQIIMMREYQLSDVLINYLVSSSELDAQNARAKKEKRLDNCLNDEIYIFNQGSAYWESLIARGKTQSLLDYEEEKTLQAAVNYCNGIYTQISKFQVKEILRIENRFK